MLKIIVLSGFVNLGIGFLKGEWETGWIDGVSVLFAVIIIVCVTATNNYMQQKQFEKLYKESEVYTLQVIRDSTSVFIKNTELLVGDLLKFAIGDILPVDGILIYGTEVLIDESNITGETKEVKKEAPYQSEIEVNNCTPYMISGSKIMDGEGYMLVCAVGKNSQVGKLKLKLQEESPPTPLQLKLEGLSNVIAKIGITASLITFFALIINAAVDIGLERYEFISFKTLDCLFNALITAVIVIVIAVPEGLPLAVTLSLAFSINKMRKENNWVRFLKGNNF
jgi:P-type Ca2+ transporter type 2B